MRDRLFPTRDEVAPQLPAAGSLAIRVTWMLTALVACAAITGLLVQDIYTGEESTAAMLRGYDLVAALVVVPGLAIAAHHASHGSVLAHLALTSLVAYVVYTDAYYLFGTRFNDLFLLRTAICSAGLLALGLTLRSLDVAVLAHRFGSPTRPRTIAAFLGVLATALGTMWLYVAIDNAITGDVPTGSTLVETDTVVHLGMALDLTVLVPLYAAAATLLWRRQPWGYALAGVALFAGTLHQLSYLVAMLVQVRASVPGAVAYDPGEPVIVFLYLTASVLLLTGTRRRRRARRRDGGRRTHLCADAGQPGGDRGERRRDQRLTVIGLR